MERLEKHKRILDDYDGEKKKVLKTIEKKVSKNEEKFSIFKHKKFNINLKRILKWKS